MHLPMINLLLGYMCKSYQSFKGIEYNKHNRVFHERRNVFYLGRFYHLQHIPVCKHRFQARYFYLCISHQHYNWHKLKHLKRRKFNNPTDHVTSVASSSEGKLSERWSRHCSLHCLQLNFLFPTKQ